MSPEQSSGSASRDPALAQTYSLPTGPWGKAACAALFLVLAITAVQCARLGVAGLFVQTAQRKIDLWTSKSRSPRKHEIRDAADFFSLALRFASANPWALEGLGALELARMRVSGDRREALAVTRTARVRFHQALVRRPTSPFLWASLALTKLYLDEIDEELLTALRHADELGPWEPSVQETVLFVGLAVWPELGPDARLAMMRTIERGAVHDAARMLEIVKSYTRLELVCAIEKYRRIAGKACEESAQVSNRGSR